MFIIEMPNKCDNVISLKQYGPTCWFNSILTSILYSDESRKLLLLKSKNWDKKILVYDTIYHILKNKYLRTDDVYKDYSYFDKIRPETILKQLYDHNNKKFNLDPKKNIMLGYISALYIKKIYKLLGVKVLYLDKKDDNLHYSIFNNAKIISNNNGDRKDTLNTKGLSNIVNSFNEPEIIIVHITTSENNPNVVHYPEHYFLSGNEILKKAVGYQNKNIEEFLTQINNLEETIKLNDEEYIIDSVLLCNWNHEQKGMGAHSIAGITCKGDKYVYNGWARSTIDPNIDKNEELVDEIPCELMRFDWNLHKKNDFCLNKKKCILDIMDIKTTLKNLCFSFNIGIRDVVYVKKNKNSNLNIKKNKECDIENVINPLSNRCIKIKSINKIPLIPLSKPEISKKKCPEETVYNPLTNRCKIPKIDKPVKKKLDKVVKVCPDGTVLNPKTNRCNKVKIDKPIKKVPKVNKVDKVPKVSKVSKVCPEGTVLNPKTNRCNKVKIDKPIKKVPKIPKVAKVCPEGTVLNPKTNRCNKIKK